LSLGPAAVYSGAKTGGLVSSLFNRRKKPIQEAVGQFVLLASFVVAVIYGGNWYPSDGIWPVLVKGSAVGLLAVFVLLSMQNFNHLLLFLALSASVAGDVLLAIPGENSFTRGLMAFLGAHVIFIMLYLKNRMLSEDITSLRVRLAALMWALAALAGYFLYPYLGNMMMPVFTYSIILAAMATTAIFSKFPIKLVGVGALLFVVSDTILGAQQFMTVPDYAGYIIWATYYLAQLLMMLGIMLTDERPTNYGGYRFD
jgi:uncharacterized membrane protein YhhN